ncbi:extracellular solute-binding protein [Oceanicoccus sp. KOV_DT_Chl]|uniref:extracellular solute-binding protein n=1 Tax=Oceanicoccus sp. KOV_DT_Chl TaxID=1904639 RepID=UPI000C7B0D0F|nr:extracellular solute-binding protein [Oceanicoccus sp. KOV_DT_Chl]
MRTRLFTLIFSVLIAGASYGNDTTISHAIAMHGNVKYPVDFHGFDYTSANAIKGGKLRLGVQGTFDSLNPFISKGSPGDNIGLIYDTLMVHSADEAFSQYGLIAERIETPADRSWVIFHLRKEARFHDGVAITADDVVFTFNLLIEKGSPLFRSYYADVQTVEALDPQRVKFTFKPGVNRELALIVGDLAILPKHYWQDRDFSKSSLEIPLGSGPYKIINADAGRSISFERVKDYWASDLPVNRGLYNYDQVQLDYYKDAVVLLEALKADRYDFRLENVSKQWATGYNSPATAKGLLKKVKIEHNNTTGMQCLLMNLRDSKFQDLRVRKALNYAFDYEWTNKNLFYGAYKRTDSFFSNSELASSGLPSPEELDILTPFKEQIPESVFTTPYTNPVSDGSGHNRGNLRIAAKLLKEAGWVVRDNVLVNATSGEPFTIEILIYMPTTERILNPYAKALQKLGIQMTVKSIEVSQFVNRLRSYDFEMLTVVIGQSLSPGNEQREYWHSTAADIEGSRNYSGIKDPVVDQLVDLVISAPDREQLIYRTRALDRVLLHNYFVVPQYHSGAHRLAYWDKFGQPNIAPKYDPSFSIGLFSWWVDPDKAQALNKAKAALNE